MKRNFWFSYLVSIIFLGVFVVLILWFFAPFIKKNSRSFEVPLPDFLTIAKNTQVSTTNLFLPKVDSKEVLGSNILNLSAKAAFIYDITTNKTIYAKNENERYPMASLTKVMTAIIALEKYKEDNKYIVFKEDLVGESSMGLSENEELTFEDLLYGLILVSANDASETLARSTYNDRNKFVKAMNEKAQALGLTNTNFTNPSGLQGEGEQYSTAYDLFVITNYALSKFPLFKKVSATVYYEIPYTNKHKAFFLNNETNLLTSYPGVKGVKTGYTPEANLCLITYLEYEGHRFIAVILGSNNRRDDMKRLLDYSLLKEGLTPPLHQ